MPLESQLGTDRAELLALDFSGAGHRRSGAQDRPESAYPARRDRCGRYGRTDGSKVLAAFLLAVFVSYHNEGIFEPVQGGPFPSPISFQLKPDSTGPAEIRFSPHQSDNNLGHAVGDSVLLT